MRLEMKYAENFHGKNQALQDTHAQATDGGANIGNIADHTEERRIYELQDFGAHSRIALDDFGNVGDRGVRIVEGIVHFQKGLRHRRQLFHGAH